MFPRARCVPIKEIILAAVAVHSGRDLRRDQVVARSDLPIIYLRSVDGGAVHRDDALARRVRRHRYFLRVRRRRGDRGRLRRGGVARHKVGGDVLTVAWRGVCDAVHIDRVKTRRRPVNEEPSRVERRQVVGAAGHPAKKLWIVGERRSVDLYVAEFCRRPRHIDVVPLDEERRVGRRRGGNGDGVIAKAVVAPTREPIIALVDRAVHVSAGLYGGGQQMGFAHVPAVNGWRRNEDVVHENEVVARPVLGSAVDGDVHYLRRLPRRRERPDLHQEQGKR